MSSIFSGKIFNILLGFFFSWLLLSTHYAVADTDPISAAKAQGIDVDRLKEIARIVMSPNGYIDKEIHGEFWKLMQNSTKPQSLLSSLELRDAMNFQREFWLSIKLSYKNKKISKTQKYLKMVEKDNGNAYEKRIIEEQGKMLKGAASHKPVRAPSGELVLITAEMATQILNGIPQIENRMEKLFNPVWQP